MRKRRNESRFSQSLHVTPYLSIKGTHMKRSITILASIALTTATAASLLFAGAASASAKPVTPRSPSNSYLSFVVPVNVEAPNQALNAQGWFSLWWLQEDDSRAYKVEVTCDDGVLLPVQMSYDLSNSRNVSYGLSFPVAEQGHECTLHGMAPADRTIAFSAPHLDHMLDHTGPGGVYVPYLRIDAAAQAVYNYPGALETRAN